MEWRESLGVRLEVPEQNAYKGSLCFPPPRVLNLTTAARFMSAVPRDHGGK